MVAELIEETTLADRWARIDAELDAIALSDYAGQSPSQAQRTATDVRRIASRMTTHVGAAVRAVHTTSPGKTASQRLARGFGNDQRSARRELKDAESTAQAGLAEQAAADGTISHRHATVIGNALRDLPADATDEQRRFAERALIRDAERLTPDDLARRGRRITDQYKTEPAVDADEDALLRRREALARAKTSLQLWDNHDGTWSGRFTLPELHGRIVKTITDALAVMDGGCTAPGCDRPPAWCEVQHTKPWKLGGNTDLKHATLHCNACHHVADQEGWTYKRVNPPQAGGAPSRMHINRGKGHGWELNHRYRP